MLIKIGTRKYHLTIGILYWYNEGKQLNLFEFCCSPLFVFVLTAWKPGIFIEIRHKTIIWWEKGLCIILARNIRFKGAK